MTLLDLPAELWTLVITELELDGAQRAIATLSETCKLCHGLLQPILFSKPELDSLKAVSRYGRLWERQVNPWTIANGEAKRRSVFHPVELSLGTARDDDGSALFDTHPCSIVGCRLSSPHSTRFHDPFPLTLIGAIEGGAFKFLTWLKLEGFRLPEEVFANLLGPASPLRVGLQALSLADVASAGPCDACYFVLEWWRMGHMEAAGAEETAEYYEEDEEGEEVVDLPRGADGQPTQKFAELATVDFSAFTQLHGWVDDDPDISWALEIADSTLSPFPFLALTALDLSSLNEWIPSIFAGSSFSHLKRLVVRGDLSCSPNGLLNRLDYALMLRSVIPDITSQLLAPVTVYSTEQQGAVPPPAPGSAPKWDSLDDFDLQPEDLAAVVGYRGPRLHPLDLSHLTLDWWDDSW